MTEKSACGAHWAVVSVWVPYTFANTDFAGLANSPAKRNNSGNEHGDESRRIGISNYDTVKSDR